MQLHRRRNEQLRPAGLQEKERRTDSRRSLLNARSTAGNVGRSVRQRRRNAEHDVQRF